jgi:spore coat polysaccharide biosynthesis protein SpsF
LIEPAVIDLLVRIAKDGEYDYVSNVDPPTYPDGLDVEVIRRSALADAHRSARLPSEREHVTPYIRKESHYRRYNVEHTPDLSGHRWTLDTAEDYLLLRTVYHHLCREGLFFGMDEVLDLLDRHPEVAGINREFRRNEGYERSIEQDHQMNEEEG